MKRVLLISYAFSPLRNPRSIQAASYVKFLPRYNWEPWVVCAEESSVYGGTIDTTLPGLVPPDTTVVRVKSFEPKIAVALAPISGGAYFKRDTTSMVKELAAAACSQA